MRWLLVIPLVFSFAFSQAQSTEKLTLLSNHLNSAKMQNEGNRIEIHQFLDTCIYDHVCGEFTGESIKEFGVVKGLALTLDRRLRCNQLARSQFLPIRINSQGKVIDHWKDYRFETE